ncbi:LexA family transcriptional regulator [Spirosoma sp. 48-14]|uniref:LexA family transcriptional regulator n=1 Tax=Spirosoma sp. 48-14 TaxID=1895854 RepID=UPI0009662B59|nr:LexA family transcriptional regulator [Spirosoma sp. 48-14]OJW78108.1 MAG: hypothetical protein BGO59_29250 [Spirosoma sp. 48-14]
MENFFDEVITMSIHEGKWLKKTLRQRGIKQEDFASDLGLSRNQLIVLMKESPFSKRYRGEMLAKLGLSEEEFDRIAQLEHDEPDDETEPEFHSPYNAKHKGSSSKLNMWWVPAKAEAGFIRGFAKRVFPSMIQRGSMPFIQGECFGFEIEGFSMFPTYLPGTYIVCTMLEDASWLKKGKVYVFQTHDGLIIKFFERIEKGLIYTRADNNNFNPVQPIPVEEIVQLYNIEFDMNRPKH